MKCPLCTGERPADHFIATSPYCRECRVIKQDLWRSKQDPEKLKAMRAKWYRNWVAKRKAKFGRK